MTIKEKAEAYDKALKQIKECMPDENGFVTIYPNEIFSELKESEDERIRKEIIAYFKADWAKEEGITRPDWIAWLEKQGEHHIACSEEQMKVLDEVLNFAANHESPYWNDYIFETLNNLIRQLKN